MSYDITKTNHETEKQDANTRPILKAKRTVITSAAMHALDPDDVNTALRRHAACDWGRCGFEAWQRNDDAVQRELRVAAVYKDRRGTSFWIITAANRSVTTILLNGEQFRREAHGE